MSSPAAAAAAVDDTHTPMTLHSWYCHIGMFHAYLTLLLETTQVHGYFKPKARRVWVEGLRVLADTGASLLRTQGTIEVALAYTNNLLKVADLITDLKINHRQNVDVSDEVFRRYVGNFYDPPRRAATPADDAQL